MPSDNSNSGDDSLPRPRADDPVALAVLAEAVEHSRRHTLAFIVAREALRRGDEPEDIVFADKELQRVVRRALRRVRETEDDKR